MRTIANIAVFDNDKCFLAMLKGYCYANDIAVAEYGFNVDGINEVEKLQPVLIVVPVNWVNAQKKSLETALLRQVRNSGLVKICGLIRNPNDVVSAGLLEWVDLVIKKPFDIREIDDYLKKTFVLNGCLIKERRVGERRIIPDRRRGGFNSDGEKINPGGIGETGQLAGKKFQMDRRNKCVVLEGQKVSLTPREFELIDLLSTDVDRIFTAEEIINQLWPENTRATKSDLYQYMHLLRKKIEKDPNNPQWIMNVKGFGYKLNMAQTCGMAPSLSLSQKINGSCQEGLAEEIPVNPSDATPILSDRKMLYRMFVNALAVGRASAAKAAASGRTR